MATSNLARYATLLKVQARMSAALAMQYRFDFVFKGMMSMFWLMVTLIPLMVVFRQKQSMVGWTYPEALVVIGWFILLKGILEGGVTPSMATVTEGIRDGRFDFTLLKPADAQFLVSTARFDPWRVIDILGSLAVFTYAFIQLGHAPSLVAVVKSLVLLGVAVVLLYSVWILVISASFYVVRVDNLSYLLASLFDAARWPVSVFHGALQILFTAVFPIALMTTYPALALLDRLSLPNTFACIVGGLAFATLARIVWRRALRNYTSASS
jgi:ABC-2 type transport system permease protein